MEKWRKIYNRVDHEQETITRQNPHGGRLLKKKMSSVISTGKRFEREKENFLDFPQEEEAILARFDETIHLPSGKTILDFSCDKLCVGERILSQNLHLYISGNEHIGIIGRNGAGKSTLMNIITDNLKADIGKILWNGEEYQNLGAKYREILGYMPQQQGLYNGFTAKRFLNYIAVLKDIPKEDIENQIEKVSKSVNLQDELSKKIEMYSGGMKQRLLIAAAIIGNPKLLIFDEPTAGLDPKERIRVKKLMSELAKDKIVIIATHIVPDIENIANEIIILKNGVLKEKDTPEKLIKKYAKNGNLENRKVMLDAL